MCNFAYMFLISGGGNPRSSFCWGQTSKGELGASPQTPREAMEVKRNERRVRLEWTGMRGPQIRYGLGPPQIWHWSYSVLGCVLRGHALKTARPGAGPAPLLLLGLHVSLHGNRYRELGLGIGLGLVIHL
jgi:hypothetical protein